MILYINSEVILVSIYTIGSMVFFLLLFLKYSGSSFSTWFLIIGISIRIPNCYLLTKQKFKSEDYTKFQNNLFSIDDLWSFAWQMICTTRILSSIPVFFFLKKVFLYYLIITSMKYILFFFIFTYFVERKQICMISFCRNVISY